MSAATHVTLVERTAKAIYLRRNGHGCRPWLNIEPDHRKPYREDARAAITTIAEALKEPPDAMFFDPDDVCVGAGQSAWSAFCEIYATMHAASPLYPKE